MTERIPIAILCGGMRLTITERVEGRPKPMVEISCRSLPTKGTRIPACRLLHTTRQPTAPHVAHQQRLQPALWSHAQPSMPPLDQRHGTTRRGGCAEQDFVVTLGDADCRTRTNGHIGQLKRFTSTIQTPSWQLPATD